MKNTITLLLTLAATLVQPSCSALSDRGKPLTSEEDQRLRARELSGIERQRFYCERELTEDQRAILDDGPPIYVRSDDGPIKVGGTYINTGSLRSRVRDWHGSLTAAGH